MTGSIPQRISALERAIDAVKADVRSCVRELLEDDGARYLVMERLPRLGSAVIEPIHELLGESDIDDEVRAMAALVGLEAGDLSVAPILLAETASRGPLAPLAARRLAAHRVDGASDAVLEAIRETGPDKVDELVAYLDALHKLDETLPDDERQRLLSAGEWQVQTAIDEWFSSS